VTRALRDKLLICACRLFKLEILLKHELNEWYKRLAVELISVKRENPIAILKTIQNQQRKLTEWA
jgi:hypothetical protein